MIVSLCVKKKLTTWRNEEAQRKGLPDYRILSNRSIDEIATTLPSTREGVLGVHGIAETKLNQYGATILAIISECQTGDLNDGDGEGVASESEDGLSVSEYLDLINRAVSTLDAKVIGEISSVDIRPRYVFFTIKDAVDGSSLPCFMWMREYELCGVELEEGMEVSVYGRPDIYKPAGRLSFRADSVSLMGEGALKKAYDDLKKKLVEEGVFADENKKELPHIPETIGLITSKRGAALGDFLNNIGRFGFNIKLKDVHVEGRYAVRDVVSAIKYFNQNPVDVIVIVRGGGSLESLQAFNTESVVREIVNSKLPVVCGVGHDKDVSLVALASDKMTSTPTAAAALVSIGWQEMCERMEKSALFIFSHYRSVLSTAIQRVDTLANVCARQTDMVWGYFRKLTNEISRSAHNISSDLRHYSDSLRSHSRFIKEGVNSMISQLDIELVHSQKLLVASDPRRLLSRGYSIVHAKDGVVKSVSDIKEGDSLEITLADGSATSVVENIRPQSYNDPHES